MALRPISIGVGCIEVVFKAIFRRIQHKAMGGNEVLMVTINIFKAVFRRMLHKPIGVGWYIKGSLRPFSGGCYINQ